MKATHHDLDIDYKDDLHFIKSMVEDDSYWDRILDAKLDFLNDGTDPRASDCVRQEIAWSWIISRNKGLQPDQPVLGEYVTKDLVEDSIERNRKMVEETRSRIRTIESLNMENDYVFELMDANGLSLLQVGDLKLHQFVGENYLVNERNAGTNAHTLSIRYKKPFAIIGPEHYCFALHGLIACAAPIIDQNNNSIGALLLTQPITDTFSPVDKRLLAHAMSLISSLANSISTQLHIDEYSSNLSTIEARYSQANLEAQLYEGLSRNLVETIKEGVLLLNSDLVVEQANPEAGHIFKVHPDDLVGSPICSLIAFEGAQDARHLFRSANRQVVSIGESDYHATPKPAFPADNSAEPSGYILTLKQASTQTLGTRRKNVGDLALTTFDGILGKSPQIAKAKKLAQRFAHASENVLIMGESGTGKELFAQAIHNVACPGGPFMSINCAAIPPRLIESELFGYEAGSFTGADKAGKPGKIELADGGTLFLDEIGDMPLELQATLLRVLENKRIMRVGGKNYRAIDFRLISATNANLPHLVSQGKFREDLLYRLSVLIVSLPPLRERSEDALYFANYFLNECQIKTGGSRVRLSEKAAAFITSYHWPGNVRQLKHAVYSAYYTCENGCIEPDDLPAYIMQGAYATREQPSRASAEEGASCQMASKKPASANALAGEPHDGNAPAPTSPAPAASPGLPSSAASPGLPASVTSPPSATSPTSAASPPSATPLTPPTSPTLPTLSLDQLESLAIEQALAQAGGSIADAARCLGISKATLYRKIKGKEAPPPEMSCKHKGPGRLHKPGPSSQRCDALALACGSKRVARLTSPHARKATTRSYPLILLPFSS